MATKKKKSRLDIHLSTLVKCELVLNICTCTFRSLRDTRVKGPVFVWHFDHNTCPQGRGEANVTQLGGCVAWGNWLNCEIRGQISCKIVDWLIAVHRWTDDSLKYKVKVFFLLLTKLQHMFEVYQIALIFLHLSRKTTVRFQNCYTHINICLIYTAYSMFTCVPHCTFSLEDEWGWCRI